MSARAAAALLVSIVLAGCAGHRDAQERDETETFVQVRRLIDDYYVDEVDRAELFEAAMGAIMGKLDPRSRLIVGDHANAGWDASSYHYLLGYAVARTDDALVVLFDLGGGDAVLESGDRIVALNGTAMEQLLDPERKRRAVWNPRSDGVAVTVEREGAGTLELEIPVNEVVHPPVWWPRLLETAGEVGYLHLSHIPGGDTLPAVRLAIETLRGRGARGVILDLRWCPGGDVRETVRIGNLFIPSGVIMNVEGRALGTTTLSASRERARFSGFPVVTLVNGQTASGGEVLAGALQDHEVGEIVGTRTYGKGTGQGSFTLPGRAQLTLTTMRWSTPDGRSADRDEDGQKGLRPDVEVPIDAGLEARLRRSVTTPVPDARDLESVTRILAGLGRSAEFGPLVDLDPQLQRAVVLLRRRIRESE